MGHSHLLSMSKQWWMVCFLIKQIFRQHVWSAPAISRSKKNEKSWSLAILDLAAPCFPHPTLHLSQLQWLLPTLIFHLSRGARMHPKTYHPKLRLRSVAAEVKLLSTNTTKTHQKEAQETNYFFLFKKKKKNKSNPL